MVPGSALCDSVLEVRGVRVGAVMAEGRFQNLLFFFNPGFVVVYFSSHKIRTL